MKTDRVFLLVGDVPLSFPPAHDDAPSIFVDGSLRAVYSTAVWLCPIFAITANHG